MDLTKTDVIAVFDAGRSWKRFQLFDRNLQPLHSEEKIIGETSGGDGRPDYNFQAIEQWMHLCLSRVVSGDIYNIRALNIAAGDDCLAVLEKILAKIAETVIAGGAGFNGRGISSIAASLVPYLKGSDKPFILVSTGTRCTFINPFDTRPGGDEQDKEGNSSRTHADVEKSDGISARGAAVAGMTPYLISGERKIRGSGFLLGEIHDSNVILLDDHFGVTGELYKTIRIKHKKVLKIQANRRGRVFFRHGIPGNLADASADLSHFLTYADAYHQMMYDLVDECLGAYRQITTPEDATEIIYVTGGFARNDTFTRILAARLPEKRLYASTIEYATALGAAMTVYNEAFDADLPEVYLGLKAILLRDE